MSSSQFILILLSLFLCSGPALQGSECFMALDDAMRISLEYQWNILISQETVYGQWGVVERAAGPFDPVFDGSYRQTELFDAQNPFFALKSHKAGQISDLTLSWKKTARIGTEYTVDWHLLKVYNPMLFPKRTNNFILTFAIDQPLLRQFRYNLASINERIALLELEALKGDFIQTIASQLYVVTQAYWNFVAAKKELTIRQEAEKRLENIAESVRKLIEGNQMAPVELNLQMAELSRVKRQREVAEQLVYSTYNQLRLALGQEAICDCSEIPDMSVEDYPLESAVELPNLRCLQMTAMENRWDLYARQLRTDEANEQVSLAANEMLPEFNVKAGTTVLNSQIDRRAHNFFTPVTSSLPEVDVFAEVRISFPFYNDFARGNFRKASSDRMQAEYLADQLQQQIRLDVATALSNRYSLLQQIQDANDAVQWYQAALDGELRKLKEGYSTLFFVLDYQDRLSAAQTEQNDTYRLYAINIANLLYLTGQFVTSENGVRVHISDARSLTALTE